jgi:ankyrin repeat protein
MENGADGLAQDANGMPALHGAIEKGNLETARAMLEKGVDVDCKDAEGDTALHYAAWKGNDEAMELLLEFTANRNALNKRDRLPIHLAMRRNHHTVVRRLFDQHVLKKPKILAWAIQNGYSQASALCER